VAKSVGPEFKHQYHTHKKIPLKYTWYKVYHLTLVSLQFGGIRYSHIVVQPSPPSPELFSCSHPETLSPLNISFLLPLASHPWKSLSTFCLYEFYNLDTHCGVTQYLSFGEWLLLLCNVSSSLFKVELYSTAPYPVFLFIHLSMNTQISSTFWLFWKKSGVLKIFILQKWISGMKVSNFLKVLQVTQSCRGRRSS
jgi:hypothetical protein